MISRVETEAILHTAHNTVLWHFNRRGSLNCVHPTEIPTKKVSLMFIKLSSIYCV